MTSVYSHLYKLYRLLLIESYTVEKKWGDGKAMVLRTDPDPGCCVICCSTGWLRSCSENIPQLGQNDNFTELLLTCFRIKLVDEEGEAKVCRKCVSRLRDASLFRKQVETVAKRFQQNQCEISLQNTPTLDVTIKKEEPDDEDIICDDIFIDSLPIDSDNNSDEPIVKDSLKCIKRKHIEDKKDNLKLEKDVKRSHKNERKKITAEKNKVSSRKELKDYRLVHKKSKYIRPRLKKTDVECPVCNKSIDQFSVLEKHFNSHFNRFLCESCGKGFASKSSLNGHMSTHGERFPCSLCNRTFARQDGRHQHIKRFHNKQKIYRCPVCKERFKTMKRKRDHMTFVHGGEHMAHHICPECKKECYTAYKLEQHTRYVHLQEKNVACPHCGKQFFGRKQLMCHLKNHGEAKYICDFCQKAFKGRKHLRRHLNIHYDIRNYMCQLCGQAFVQSTSLKVHMRSHHKSAVENDAYK